MDATPRISRVPPPVVFHPPASSLQIPQLAPIMASERPIIRRFSRPAPVTTRHSQTFQSRQGWINFLRRLLKTKERICNQSQLILSLCARRDPALIHFSTKKFGCKSHAKTTPLPEKSAETYSCGRFPNVRRARRTQGSRTFFTKSHPSRPVPITNHHSPITIHRPSNRHKRGLEITVTPFRINKSVASNRHRFGGPDSITHALLLQLSNAILREFPAPYRVSFQPVQTICSRGELRDECPRRKSAS